MNWISRFFPTSWTLVLGALLLLMVLIIGVQLGERRVQKTWDEERQRIALSQAKQEQRVADVVQSQRSINQEISNDFQEKKKLLAGLRPVIRTGNVGLRLEPSHSLDALPGIPTVTGRTAAAASDAVSDSAGTAPEMNCDLLSFDAAQTTLMVVEFQRWYREQAGVSGMSDE
jgi:hypothetical protein